MSHSELLALTNVNAFLSNDVDMIVFSVYGNRYKQCSDDPMGTYIAEVPYFLEGYLAEKAQEMQDSGYDDYAEPDSAQYIYCTPYVIQNVQYYMQIGCADDTSQALAINIYEDDACTVRSMVDGYDDSNIDVSDIQVSSSHCFKMYCFENILLNRLCFFFISKKCRYPLKNAKRASIG